MRALTDNEKAYLQLAYDKGYRYIATERYGGTYFYSDKVKKYSAHDVWLEQFTCKYTSSLCDFGTKWEDEESTKIADLLGIDEVDWSKVKQFTPVWISCHENTPWQRAYFLKYKKDELFKFRATVSGAWSFAVLDEVSWKYCKIATQDEINEVTGGNRA